MDADKEGNTDLNGCSANYDYICGLHSNIPLCCVEFFTSGAWRIIRDKVMDKLTEPVWCEVKGQGAYICHMWLNNDAEYIMCPDCLVRFMEKRFKPHNIKPCTCSKT